MPKISVIMPFYNCEKYLDESIGSILNQTFSDFEFIIINDASTDNSDEIVSKYLTDKRIIYIKNENNKGIVENLNYGISIAKGEYIARMDGDDISMLDRFQKQIDFLEKNKDIVLLGANANIIDEYGNIIGEIKKPEKFLDIQKDIFLYSTFIHPVIIIKSDVLKKFLYRSDYLYAEDYDLWLRIVYSNYRVANISNVLLYYRKHSNSSSKNSKEIAQKNFLLRKETIKKFGLKIGLKGYIFMYAHYILGMILTGKQKEKLEYFIKKILVLGKK